MNDTEHHSEKEYAALAFALGVTRGILFDVVDGQFAMTDVRRVYEATALFRIAESIDMTESDLFTEWDDSLSLSGGEVNDSRVSERRIRRSTEWRPGGAACNSGVSGGPPPVN